MPKKQPNMKQLLLKELLEDSLTKTEIKEAFSEIVKMVKKMGDKNKTEMKGIDDNLKKAVNEYMSSTTSGLDMTKKELKAFIDKEIIRVNKEHLDKLGEVDKRMAEVKDGKDADEIKIIDEVMGKLEYPTMENIKKELPIFGEEIRNALELLKGDERLEQSAVNGLTEELKNLREAVEKKATTRVVSGPNANAILSIDISDQANGTNKVFTIPTCRKVLMVIGTDFPTVYKQTTDYTVGNKTITFTSAVDAPIAGQNLEVLYKK